MSRKQNKLHTLEEWIDRGMVDNASYPAPEAAKNEKLLEEHLARIEANGTPEDVIRARIAAATVIRARKTAAASAEADLSNSARRR